MLEREQTKWGQYIIIEISQENDSLNQRTCISQMKGHTKCLLDELKKTERPSHFVSPVLKQLRVLSMAHYKQL